MEPIQQTTPDIDLSAPELTLMQSWHHNAQSWIEAIRTGAIESRLRVTDQAILLAVMGHQPLLKPGEKFEYTSWMRLATTQGTMRGTYFCMTEDARPFEASVPEFVLTRPEQLH